MVKTKQELIAEKEALLGQYAGDDKMVYSYEMQSIIKLNRSQPFNIASRYFPSLTESIGGFDGGEVIVVSGWTGNGKTTFCQSLTKDFADQSIISAWFSYEVQPYYFLKKFGDLPIFVMPMKLQDKDFKWLIDRIWEAKIKYGISVVFIDHLHFVIDVFSRNISHDIGVVMRKLKKLALQFNICIFLVAHTMKPTAQTGETLGLGSVRDSGFIEAEADTVLYVWRSKDKENGSFLKIAKDRKNGCINKKIKLLMFNRILREEDVSQS